MANLPWLDEVLRRLTKRGLPPNYVQRFAEELSDHLEDIKEENMNTEADAYSRLGKPEQVADAAVAAYQRHSFLGRHPMAAFLVFAISPVVSLLALFCLAYCGVYVFYFAYEQLGGDINAIRHLPGASAVMPYVLSLLTIVLPAIIASSLYCWLVRRLGIGRKWLLLACIMLAVVAAMPCCSVTLSNVPGHSAFRWGVLNPQSIKDLFDVIPWIFCRPQQLMQFLVPLAIAWWFMRRKGDEVRLQLAS
jgi:hypothetical protein